MTLTTGNKIQAVIYDAYATYGRNVTAADLAKHIEESGVIREALAEAYDLGRTDFLAYLGGARKKVPYPTNPFK